MIMTYTIQLGKKIKNLIQKNSSLLIICILILLLFTCNRPNTIYTNKPIIYTEYRDSIIPNIIIPNYSDTNRNVKVKQSIFNHILGRRENYYKVKKGDNLYRLSLKYNTTVERLMKLNNISTPDIEKGQWLYIGTQEERFVVSDTKDSLYHYSETYGNDTLKAIVETNTIGPIQDQSVKIESKPIYIDKKRSSILIGSDFSNNPNQPVDFVVGYNTKKGWLYTGRTSFLGSNRYYGIGVYKNIYLKK